MFLSSMALSVNVENIARLELLNAKHHTDKNHQKNLRKRQKNFPNFLKMRIFLSTF